MVRYDLSASDIMQVEVATIVANATASEAVHQMRLEGVRSLIIVPLSSDESYAIVTYTDIVHKVLAEGRDPAHVRVEEIMTHPLIAISPDMKVKHIARLFRHTGIGHVPVIDCGKLLGVVSMTDLITEVIAEAG